MGEESSLEIKILLQPSTWMVKTVIWLWNPRSNIVPDSIEWFFSNSLMNSDHEGSTQSKTFCSQASERKSKYLLDPTDFPLSLNTEQEGFNQRYDS